MCSSIASQVYNLYNHGYTVKQIAEYLGISSTQVVDLYHTATAEVAAVFPEHPYNRDPHRSLAELKMINISFVPNMFKSNLNPSK